MAYALATALVGGANLLSGFYIRVSAFKVQPLVWLSYLSFPRCERDLPDSTPPIFIRANMHAFTANHITKSVACMVLTG